MKMIPGSGSISNYAAYIYNCTLNQYNYKIPVNSLQDVQLYIDIGPSSPGSAGIELIHTCGPTGGTVESLSTSEYVIGQDTNDNFYGVFRNFNESTTASCFVIAITLGGTIYFSQEYCIDTLCKTLTNIQGCYGNLDPLISYDNEGIYFGLSQGGTAGDGAVVYEHRALLREVAVDINGKKTTFKKGRTRNFRTESEKIYRFWSEFVPGWYLEHLDAIFERGEVYVGETKYLLESTGYELLDDCLRTWRPTVSFTKSHFQSFSCELEPCVIVLPESGGGGETGCCDPQVINATVEGNEGNTITINFTPCSPAPANGYVVLWRVVGSGGSYTNAGSFGSSPAVFLEGTNPDGTQYEGYIYSDCGGGQVGNFQSWSTGATSSNYSFQLVSQCTPAGYSPLILSGGTEGDIVVVRVTFSGNMAKVAGSFVRADLKVRSPYVTDPPTFSPIPEFNDSSACYIDTVGHGFNVIIDITMIVPASGSVTLDAFAIVNNSQPAIPKGIIFELITVNGGSVTGVSQLGCTTINPTAGTC